MPTSVTTLSNIAALEAFSGGSTYPVIFIEGYSTVDDGGSGTFVYVSTDHRTTGNGGTIILDADGNVYYRETIGSTYSVKWFGAMGNGSNPDATPIQNTINALPASGGTVFFPTGQYLIDEPLVIGNGTASADSTTHGILLLGEGQPIFPVQLSPHYPSNPSPTALIWGGTSSGASLLTIAGPLRGWGLKNLYLNGGETCANGLVVISSAFGDCQNLAFTEFKNFAIYSTAVPVFISGQNVDSLHNSYKNIFIFVPDIAGSIGIDLTGSDDNSANTDYNDFENIYIALNDAVLTYAIYLQSCDSNQFRNIHFSGGGTSGGVSGGVGVIFDYSLSGGTYPCGNMFYGIDPAGPTTQFQNVGTPSSAHRSNGIFGLIQSNNATYPKLPNLNPGLPITTDVVDLVSQTGTIVSTSLSNIAATGLFRVSIYLSITTPGNAVNVSATVQWPDGAAIHAATTAQVSAAADNYTQSTFVIQTTANTITYSTAVSGPLGSGQYQLHISVEQIAS